MHAVSLNPATSYNTFRFDHSHPVIPPPLDHHKLLHGHPSKGGERGGGLSGGKARSRAVPKTQLYKWKSVSGESGHELSPHPAPAGPTTREHTQPRPPPCRLKDLPHTLFPSR